MVLLSKVLGFFGVFFFWDLLQGRSRSELMVLDLPKLQCADVFFFFVLVDLDLIAVFFCFVLCDFCFLFIIASSSFFFFVLFFSVLNI